jgi:dTDP-4-dehydrorhamnose 3,5-epimerase-like enzyme
MKLAPVIIDLPRIMDKRGNLSFIESSKHIPFDIMRAYWIYDVPGGEIRGGHAFRTQHEFIIALSGSFDVVIDNGRRKKRFSLNRSYFGLYVPPGIWRSMENFSTNSLAFVLASTLFDEKDYIRNYSEFLSQPQPQPQPKAKVEAKVEVKVKIKNSTIQGFGSPSESSSVNDCKVIELEKNHRIKGNITVIENNEQVPFHISRVYYLYDVPGGEERGGHAHYELNQLIVAAGGSFEVALDDGKDKWKVILNRPYQGLCIAPGIWRELVNFSSGSTCLVLASHNYDEGDYIRDYQEFLKFKQTY